MNNNRTQTEEDSVQAPENPESQDDSENQDSAVIANSLENIAEELKSDNNLEQSDEPRVLIMVRNRAARATVNTIKEAGFYTITPTMGDRRYDAPSKLAHETAELGTKRNDALPTNAYAVITCAKNCEAQAIFLCDGSTELADDPVFLAHAYHDGIRVFTPVQPDTLSLGWRECEPSEEAMASYDNLSWRTCHKCGLTFDESDFAIFGLACPACKTLARMSSSERIESLLDAHSFEEWDTDLSDVDPLDFPGYTDKLASQREKSNFSEAIRTGIGTIRGVRCAFGFMDSSFFMGSMGHVVGEKVSRLFDRATEMRLPVVIFCTSGGARMQEGLISLMQMAKTACACERHDKAGLLYVSVLTDPTTGGVTASFAMLGDIILAEPNALIGFAGQRVIRDTIKQELPKGFQTAEFALEHGLIDAIVQRSDMRDTLAHILALHAPDSRERYLTMHKHDWADPQNRITVSATAEDEDQPLTLAERIFALSNIVTGNPERALERHERRKQRELKRAGIPETPEPGSAWESVQIARNVHRPTARCYVEAMCEDFIELHGDRAFADDPAIFSGIGWVNGQPVTIIAQEKGMDLNDRIRRNFGCPQPEGYRKTIRLMRQAEKFGRPVVCLVDTQGAFCGMGAEERGQGNAIAENLAELAGLRTRVISVLLGEGGSGGALALAVADRIAMQEHAVYSVASPEGCASILWKDRSRAPEAAQAMRMSAQEVYDMGIIDEVIPEGEQPAHVNPEDAIVNVCLYIFEAMAELENENIDQVVADRQARFAKF